MDHVKYLRWNVLLKQWKIVTRIYFCIKSFIIFIMTQIFFMLQKVTYMECRGVFRTQPNEYLSWSLFAKIANGFYSAKMIHHICLTEFWINIWVGVHDMQKEHIRLFPHFLITWMNIWFRQIITVSNNQADLPLGCWKKGTGRMAKSFDSLSSTFSERTKIKFLGFTKQEIVSKQLLINQFQPSVAFHMETSNSFCCPTEMTGFYMKRSPGLK